MRCVTIHVQQQQQQQIHVTTQVAENLQRSSNPIQKPNLCLFIYITAFHNHTTVAIWITQNNLKFSLV